MLAARIERVALDVTKHYMQVTSSGKETYVGQFVKVYRMGSGDGMIVHLEFNNNGNKLTINEEMWGFVSGAELSCLNPCLAKSETREPRTIAKHKLK